MNEIENIINELDAGELRQVLFMLSERNHKAEKDLYDILTLIRANKRARGRG